MRQRRLGHFFVEEGQGKAGSVCGDRSSLVRVLESIYRIHRMVDQRWKSEVVVGVSNVIRGENVYDA